MTIHTYAPHLQNGYNLHHQYALCWKPNLSNSCWRWKALPEANLEINQDAIRYTTPILSDGVFLRSLIGASAEFIVRSHNSRVSISTTVAQVTLPKRYPGPFLGQLRHPPRVGRKSTTPKSPFLEGNLLNLIASSNVTSLVKKNSHHRKGSRLMGFLFACSECLLCLDCWRHDPV